MQIDLGQCHRMSHSGAMKFNNWQVAACPGSCCDEDACNLVDGFVRGFTSRRRPGEFGRS